jgi:hypothetical protein
VRIRVHDTPERLELFECLKPRVVRACGRHVGAQRGSELLENELGPLLARLVRVRARARARVRIRGRGRGRG